MERTVFTKHRIKAHTQSTHLMFIYNLLKTDIFLAEGMIEPIGKHRM